MPIYMPILGKNYQILIGLLTFGQVFYMTHVTGADRPTFVDLPGQVIEGIYTEDAK